MVCHKIMLAENENFELCMSDPFGSVVVQLGVYRHSGVSDSVGV